MKKLRGIIFLDIDGVLNNQIYSTKDYVSYTTGKTEERGYDMDPKNVKWLNRLVKATNAQIVCSSTWRSDMDKVRRTLAEKGCKYEVLDRTPYLDNRYDTCRGNEIEKWMEDYKKNNDDLEYDSKVPFVILDDDSDMLYWHRHHYCYVNGIAGFNLVEFLYAVFLLKRTFIIERFAHRTRYRIIQSFINVWHDRYLIRHGMKDTVKQHKGYAVNRKKKAKLLKRLSDPSTNRGTITFNMRLKNERKSS